jgi:hypothetical protein
VSSQARNMAPRPRYRPIVATAEPSTHTKHTMTAHNTTVACTAHRRNRLSPGVHNLGNVVHKDQHVVAQLLVDVLEVVDVAEAKQRIHSHTGQERVDRRAATLGGQVRRDDACPGLAEAHAQQACREGTQ